MFLNLLYYSCKLRWDAGGTAGRAMRHTITEAIVQGYSKSPLHAKKRVVTSPCHKDCHNSERGRPHDIVQSQPYTAAAPFSQFFIALIQRA